MEFVAKDREIYPGIWRKDDRCGGQPTIGQTRISVWVVEGMSDTEVGQEYPTLRGRDLRNVRAFVAGARWGQRDGEAAVRRRVERAF